MVCLDGVAVARKMPEKKLRTNSGETEKPDNPGAGGIKKFTD